MCEARLLEAPVVKIHTLLKLGELYFQDKTLLLTRIADYEQVMRLF